MIDLDNLYFEWLLTCLDPDGVTEEVADLCSLLHELPFRRRVGKDINRAADGANLRKTFLIQFSDANFDPHVTNDLMMQECSWLEMLIALAIALDYTYEGGVEGRFIELITNMGLDPLLAYQHHRTHAMDERDAELVARATSRVDNNEISPTGHGGLFPLEKFGHPDQRKVEIWDQHAAYFSEKLEGVLWTSTN